MGIKIVLTAPAVGLKLGGADQRIVLLSPVIVGPTGESGAAYLPPEPTPEEITAHTEPALRSWSVTVLYGAVMEWLAAWAALNLGSAAGADTGDFDAAGAAGGVQSNLNTHLNDVAPHFGAVSQVDAEAGTSTALGWWSAARVKQAITAIARTLGGVSDNRVDITPSNGSSHTIDYNEYSGVKFNVSGLTSGQAFAYTISNRPTGAKNSSIAVDFEVGANINIAITHPSGVVAPTLTASKLNRFILASDPRSTTAWNISSAEAFT